MAGGKETPRQKMIGMMYLVLTALLALNVSSETLQKFIYLNKSLERQVSENMVKNGNVIDRIKSAVEESGNRETDLAVLSQAEKVRQQTEEIIKYTNDMKEEMIQISGGYDEEGNLVGAQDLDKVANFMINKKKGEELKTRLNEYSTFLTKELDDTFPPLAYDGENHPDYRDDKEQKRKDFATLTFESTPTAAGLASVSQIQTEIMAYEAKALEDLARKVGAGDVKFDVITPMVKPVSNIVAAGTKYEADLFIAASSSGITPTMAVNGNQINVVGGKGKVEFTASAGNYDNDGIAKKSYEAAITITMPGGRDTTFTDVIEYFVAKPVIQVQSAAMQQLYLNCGNELNIQVPQLGAAYNPSFSAKGAQVINGAKKGFITVIPNAASVDVNVSSSGNYIGKEVFKVKRIPQPSLVPKARGRELDMKTGEKAPGPRSLTIDVVPDENFAAFLPKDARYRAVEWTAYLARGNRPVDQITATGQTANLTKFASQARAGDRIVVEVKRVQRMNFKDKLEDVKLPTSASVFNIPLQ